MPSHTSLLQAVLVLSPLYGLAAPARSASVDKVYFLGLPSSSASVASIGRADINAVTPLSSMATGSPANSLAFGQATEPLSGATTEITLRPTQSVASSSPVQSPTTTNNLVTSVTSNISPAPTTWLLSETVFSSARPGSSAASTLYISSTHISQETLSPLSSFTATTATDTSSSNLSHKPASTNISGTTQTTNPRPKPNAESQQGRRSAVLAAFLTVGTLVMLGVTFCCMRCKLPEGLRRNKRRSRRVRFDIQDTEIEPSGLIRPREKDEKESLIPGMAPMIHDITLPTLPQHSHIFPGVNTASLPHPTGRRVLVSDTMDGHFEDVTHILSTDAFAPPLRYGGESSAVDSVISAASDTTSSAREEHSGSRTSGGSASLTGLSYKSCESRYSTPSVERQLHDGPLRSGSIESLSPSLSFGGSPSPPSSELVQTPEQILYSNPRCMSTIRGTEPMGSKEPHMLVRGLRISDADTSSEWDVARSYGAHSSVGKDSLLVMVENMEEVEVGGKKCVLVQG
ncbi:uncharacterized protein FIBRA_04375 [Fibroporia radiculosa]|uniref:REJ domain-containing protein n=1 Tax=Fibroporia radiculosa TaxID=599839 RepID=J4HWH8_9APHY|nr:uncharacterized protein FIBRA_04375 [Fibroporia radiculosa]CCM02287.1 predicted protein [Fibroporia radiculosa]